MHGAGAVGGARPPLQEERNVSLQGGRRGNGAGAGREDRAAHEGEIWVVKRPVSGWIAQIGRAMTPEPPSQMRSIGAAGEGTREGVDRTARASAIATRGGFWSAFWMYERRYACSSSSSSPNVRLCKTQG